MRSVRSTRAESAAAERHDGTRNILIVGADFRNQGAYLMMVATVAEITRRFEGNPVLGVKVGNPAQRRRVGALTMLPVSTRIPHTAAARKLSAKGGVVDHRDIDIVFDASGFFYSDSWTRFISGRARLHQMFGELGVPAYFLPQAFGPFDVTSDVCATALSTARAVYPRDPTSEAHLQTLAKQHHISLRTGTPDFTCLVKAPADTDWSELSGAVPIIPNYNIMRRASREDALSYLRNLAGFTLAARNAGRYVYGLSHEGRKDTQILRELAKQVGGLRIVDGYDGVALKALLNTAPYAVVGRYHAAVSCLSQGKPLIAHGWSHKYQHLMADFHQGHRLLDPYVPMSSAELKTHVEQLENFSGSERDELESSGASYRQKSKDMWEEIQRDVAN